MVAQAKAVRPNVVNGINVDDLFALIDGVKRDVAKAKTNWHVTTTWCGQTRSRAQVDGFGIGGEQVTRRFSIDIDEPCELGGSNQFANPQEHLLAALNACMTVGYVAQCAVHGIVIESLKIETDGEIDLRGFLGIDPAVPAMTFSRPTSLASRTIRSFTNSGCSTTLVAWLMTPGMSTEPFGSLTSFQTCHSCSWRGFAPSIT
jgi:hypothetical protein